MFAVLETGGKQVKAQAGCYIDIEKIQGTIGEKISLNTVLMFVNGDEIKVGNPYLKNTVINGEIIDQNKDDKVIVYKMRPKKGTRKKQGHRQLYSRVLVKTIEIDGKVVAEGKELEKTKTRAQAKKNKITKGENEDIN